MHMQPAFDMLETALAELVNARQRELWQRQNAPAIQAYNQLVEERGTFGDELRGF
ncbi:MAG: type II toxin-antitoxin system CcdA family antitoxin [Gammaproteobacteria bacterium]|nr:type II toxin-antitoxin system CcdA family antitoxin [Gammaproteobacteria bacterium]